MNPHRVASELFTTLMTLSAVLAVGSLIGGPVLRASCALFNLMAANSKPHLSVPEPTFGKAMAIVLGTLILQLPIDFLVELKLNPGQRPPGGWSFGFLFLRSTLFWLVGVFITSGLVSGLLPTGFGRASLVSLLYNAFLIPIVAFATLLLWILGWSPLGLGPR
jgi:hypothetical protein